MAIVELRYARGTVSSKELEEEGSRVLAELASGDSTELDDLDADIDKAAVRSVSITVIEDKQGIDPSVADFIITVSGELAASALTHLFVNVIWKRIRKRRGADALGKKKDDDETEGPASSNA